MIPAPPAPVTPTPSNLPPNLPIVNISSDQIGAGWRKPEIGEFVGTNWQYYALFIQPPRWIMSGYCTSDQQVHNGRTLYRVPNSVWTKIKVAPLVFLKVWNRVFKIKPPKPNPPLSPK